MFGQGISWGLLGPLIVCLGSTFNAPFVTLVARLCQRLVLKEGPEKHYPHSTWNARTDQQGFLTHLVPSGERNNVAGICSQEWRESVASSREKEGFEMRLRETRSHRPRHTGMGFHAKKL